MPKRQLKSRFAFRSTEPEARKVMEQMWKDMGIKKPEAKTKKSTKK